jgi:hypothetical protein
MVLCWEMREYCLEAWLHKNLNFGYLEAKIPRVGDRLAYKPRCEILPH